MLHRQETLETAIITALVVAALILFGVWIWRWSRAEDRRACQGTTRLVLSGSNGGVVTGYYIQDGRRIAIANTLPWSFAKDGISSFELTKATSDDTVVLEMSCDGDGVRAKTKDLLVRLCPEFGRGFRTG